MVKPISFGPRPPLEWRHAPLHVEHDVLEHHDASSTNKADGEGDPQQRHVCQREADARIEGERADEVRIALTASYIVADAGAEQ